MSRAPFQVLVFPVAISVDGPRYALFRRGAETGGYWQGVAGGGENGESPLEAARREAFEEAGLPERTQFVQLDARAMLPVVNVCGFLWGEAVLVIPEFAFGAIVPTRQCVVSNEHSEYGWFDFDAAMSLVKWDSNRTALWELDWRIRHSLIR